MKTTAPKNKNLKICVGASAGGHMTQLTKLLKTSDNWPYQPSFYVTTLDVIAKKLSEDNTVYVTGECNRNTPFKAVKVFFKSLAIVIKQRPDVVITTGAMPLLLLCICAKLFGAKIVWIDSIANIERFSMSGRFIRRYADLFLTQWPELAENNDNVEYAGAIV